MQRQAEALGLGLEERPAHGVHGDPVGVGVQRGEQPGHVDLPLLVDGIEREGAVLPAAPAHPRPGPHHPRLSRRTVPAPARTLGLVRIVSLLPSATEIVFALGRGKDLVGVTFECDFPPEARQRRVVSTSALPEGLSPREIDAVVTERMAAGEDLYRLDEGALAELDADIILTQDLCAVCAVDATRVDDALAYLGCSAQVVTLDPNSLDEVVASIGQVGAVLGAEDEAAALEASLRRRLDHLAGAVAGAAAPSVLVLEWTDPPFSAGHWVPDLVAAGGGRPVLGNPGGDSQRIGWGDVETCGADVVIVAPCGCSLQPAVELACQVTAAGRLPAGAEVWAVDADAYVVRPGPRVVHGAELVGEILHPDRRGHPDPGRAHPIRPQ
jgi:iron complex transport system substrate-binding protein